MGNRYGKWGKYLIVCKRVTIIEEFRVVGGGGSCDVVGKIKWGKIQG